MPFFPGGEMIREGDKGISCTLYFVLCTLYFVFCILYYEEQ